MPPNTLLLKVVERSLFIFRFRFMIREKKCLDGESGLRIAESHLLQ